VYVYAECTLFILCVFLKSNESCFGDVRTINISSNFRENTVQSSPMDISEILRE